MAGLPSDVSRYIEANTPPQASGLGSSLHGLGLPSTSLSHGPPQQLSKIRRLLDGSGIDGLFASMLVNPLVRILFRKCLGQSNTRTRILST